jgi:hypothetical protein
MHHSDLDLKERQILAYCKNDILGFEFNSADFLPVKMMVLA